MHILYPNEIRSAALLTPFFTSVWSFCTSSVFYGSLTLCYHNKNRSKIDLKPINPPCCVQLVRGLLKLKGSIFFHK